MQQHPETPVLDYVAKQIWKGIALVAVIAGAVYVYQTRFPHVVSTLVYINGNWMEGEKQTCILNRSQSPYQLDCTVKASAADLEPHRFDVSYSGADLEELAKRKPSSWTCTRAEGAISCSLDETISQSNK